MRWSFNRVDFLIMLLGRSDGASSRSHIYIETNQLLLQGY